MNDAHTPIDLTILSLCVILTSFDHDLVFALSDCTEDGILSLLTSDLVVPMSESAGVYRLREDVRADVQAQLRNERPYDEIRLHMCAFEYFLRRMQQAETANRDMADEKRCFYHLGELRELLTEHRQWSTIAQHVAAARAAKPQLARHLHLLSLYEGFVAVRTQDYERGEEMLMALLNHPDLDNDVRIRVLHALGLTYWFQARYDRALMFCQQFYQLARETGDLVYQGGALINMSMIYNETSYYNLALDLLMQSLSIFRELRDRYREARVLWHIGNNEMQLGRWQAAQRHFHEAISLYEALGVQASLANLYWCQGCLYHMMGDEHKSEISYQRALAIAQSPKHGDPKAGMDVSLYLGFLYQTLGRWNEAMTNYEQAKQLAHQLHDQHLLAHIHYQRGNLFKYQGQLDETMTAYREAIDSIEALRGDTEDEAIKMGLLGTTQQLYEAMVLLCLERDRPDEAFEYVERARSRAFLDTLAQKAPELYNALEQPVVTLAEIQAHLPPDALLIEYFTTGVLPRGEHLLNKIPVENIRLREHLTLPPQVWIFAITHDRIEVHRAALDPNTLRPQPDDHGPGRRMLRDRLLMLLYERLIEPVQHLLHGRNLLYLIPHGPLHYVPFMALRSTAGEHLLDASGPALAMAPSATILLCTCLNQPRSQATDFLALGYNDQGNEALHYAEVEAGSIARLMNGQSWTGSAPKSQRLMAVGSQIRWLHIAGHAIYNPRDPLSSELRLGADDSLSAREIISGLELQTDLVTLSACTSGLSHVVPGDELLGLQRAFLYAGAPTVVCTLWEASDLISLLLMERFYTGLCEGRPAATALRDAQVAVREMTGRELEATLDRWRAEAPEYVDTLGDAAQLLAEQPNSKPFSDPFYWAPFMLIGRPY